MKSLPRPNAEQLEAVPRYIRKWFEIATSTERIDCTRVKHIIGEIYSLLGLNLPPLHFFDSPQGAMAKLEEVICRGNYAPLVDLYSQWEDELKKRLCLDIMGYPDARLCPVELRKRLNEVLRPQLDYGLHSGIISGIWHKRNSSIFKTQPWYYRQYYSRGFISPEFWAPDGCYLDWLITELKCEHSPSHWRLFQALINECGWVMPFEEICLVCERPTKISFDSEGRLHAEPPQPAIEFSDGFSVYAINGVKVPRRYGSLPLLEWDARWYREEKMPGVKRVILDILPPEKIDRAWLLSEPVPELQRLLAQKLGREVTELTLPQMERLPYYYQKWRDIALRPGPIDREKAAAAMVRFYELGGSLFGVKIIFAPNPLRAQRFFKRNCRRQSFESWPYKKRLSNSVIQSMFGNESYYNAARLSLELLPIDRFARPIFAQLNENVFKRLCDTLIVDRSWSLESLSYWVQPERLTVWCALFDFCISVLGCLHDAEFWSVLQDVAKECGPFYPGQPVCIIYERPALLRLDEKDRPHADEGVAIVYPDGYKRRAYGGVSPRKRKQTKRGF